MRTFIQSHRRGSALITVIFLIAMMALLTGSMLKYTISERRGNERNRLTLRSKNMAENVTLYVSEQISNKLRKMRSVSQMKFTTTSSTNRIYLPPDNVLVSNYSAASDVESYAGITSNTSLQLITDATNTNYGLQALTGTVPIIAKSTMSHPSLGSITTYAEQDMQITEVPLFQFAIFYNKDLEVSPGADMVIAGPVHSNGDFIARSQTGFSNTIQFKDRVSAVGGFYANTGYKGTIYNEYDNADAGPGGSGALKFQNPSGTVTNIYGSSTWRDHKYGGSTVTTTSLANFKTFATNTYAGNLRTSVHQVSTLALPGVDDSAANSGRTTIKAPDSSDSAEVILAGTQISRKAGLYIITNPTAQTRTGKLPDASTVSMRPYSYRCWLNTVNTDGTHTIREVILPGQPSYGDANAYVNNLPNAYRVDTAVGSNQVLRIPQGTANTNVDLADTGYATGTPSLASFQDAYFYDMRRASNSNGHPFSRSSANFIPRPIAKIDFDMTRFKMAVNRTYSGATTATVYNPARPNSTIWSNSIYNSSASAAAFGLGLATGSNTAFSLFPTQGPVYSIQKSRTGAYFPASISITGYYQTGSGGTVTGYSGYFTIETYNGSSWTTAYTSAGNQSAYTYSTSSIPSGTTQIRISQYVAGSTSNLLDQQIIPVVDETATTVSAALSNERGIVPCSSSSSGFLYTDQMVTDMRVFVGGVDDTANWTFAVTSTASGITGSLGSGQFANRYTVTAVNNSFTSGNVRITASRSGYSSIYKDFTVIKQSSLTGGAASPGQTGYWAGIGNGQAPDPFKLYFAPSDPNDSAILTNPATFAVASTDLYNAGSGPWYDGVTVYIHSVDAETLTESSAGVRDRMDSGVRLWNGRGPAPSLTNSGCTGFTFCTNDAVYIVGHFNADGSANSNSSDTSAYGGYSARYPDSANEYLASVMGDALTIYSQPVFTSSSGNYYQTGGWSDSLSANRCRSTNWSSSWQTSNPGSSNAVDGTATSITPAFLPNLGNIGTAAPGGSAVTVKCDPSVTEVSACLLAGIVETNSHQHSGGVHNFPRLNEDWSGTGLYIRGSMVAMFASEIATEPWSIRIYSGAGRYWGLNIGLTDPATHDLPLEPMLISASRLAYRELTPSEYSSMKTTILALP